MEASQAAPGGISGRRVQLRNCACIAERPEANDPLYFKILDIHCRCREDLCRGDVPTNGMNKPVLRAGRTPRRQGLIEVAIPLRYEFVSERYPPTLFLQSHDSEENWRSRACDFPAGLLAYA